MSQIVERRSGLGPGSVLFMCLFAAQAAILVLSPILPEVAAEFGITTSVAAQLRSVSGFTAGIVALLLAVTGNRFRLSLLLNAGLALLAAGSLISAWAPTFDLLLVAQVVIGFGLAAVLSGGLAASKTWAKDGESTRVLSWALIGQPVAWIVGQPLVGVVASQGWRWAWVAVPFVASLAALAAMSLRSKSTNDSGHEHDPLGLWRQPGVKAWAISELLAFAAWAGTLIYAGALFIGSYQTSVAATGVILGVGAVFYLPGNSLGRRLLDRGSNLLLFGFSLAAAAVVIIFGSVRPGLVFSAVIFSLAAFFAAGRTIAGAALGLQLADERRLTAMSIRTSTVQFGYLFGAAIGGLLLEQWGFTGIGWGFGLLFAASAAIHLPKAISRSPEPAKPARHLLRRHQTSEPTK